MLTVLVAETVKVPQMAESITEGTLKQWTKQVGDHVEQDEEVATIETDKVRPSLDGMRRFTCAPMVPDLRSSLLTARFLD
jgi:hypothetical protein